MNKEKSVKIFSLVLFGLLFVNLVGFVLAANANPADAGQAAGVAAKNLGTGILSFINALFGDTVIGNEGLSRLFMAILVAMFVYTAFESFFPQKEGKFNTIGWIATIAATVLAIYGIPGAFLDAIRTGYGAMGAAILSIIPFMVIFWFSIKTKSSIMARGTWLFFTVYYLALFLSNFLSEGINVLSNAKGSSFGATWAYFIALIAGIIMFFFIMKIRWKFFTEELASEEEIANKKVKSVGLKKELAEKMWETVSGVKGQ